MSCWAKRLTCQTLLYMYMRFLVGCHGPNCLVSKIRQEFFTAILLLIIFLRPAFTYNPQHNILVLTTLNFSSSGTGASLVLELP